eukprot:5740611-Prymnesium_polylepis.1
MLCANLFDASVGRNLRQGLLHHRAEHATRARRLPMVRSASLRSTLRSPTTRRRGNSPCPRLRQDRDSATGALVFEIDGCSFSGSSLSQ